jgi:sulfur transfer complex TusBCD TusB component (DsrH family)
MTNGLIGQHLYPQDTVVVALGGISNLRETAEITEAYFMKREVMARLTREEIAHVLHVSYW